MARAPRLDRELGRYLVVGETPIVAVRKHWFSLSREIGLVLAATAFFLWIDANTTASPGSRTFYNLALALWWAALLWFAWQWLNWRRDWFVATDKRFLLFYGFLRRKVAMMPLQKVTDMTYDRSIIGRIVGYGTFTLESAGQDQALSAISHVPDADTHYKAICTQLFGPAPARRADPDDLWQPPPVDPGDGHGGGPGGGGGTSPGPQGAGPQPATGRGDGGGHEQHDRIEPTEAPESWYRSSNLRGPLHLGDTGEIPVVRVPREQVEADEGVTLYPPREWR